MKLSYTISTSKTRFIACAQGDWKDTVKFMSGLGYDGVELAIRNPDSIDVKELNKVLNENNIALAAIGTGQAFIEEGISLTSDEEKKRSRALERLKKHVDFAENFGSPVIIGLIKGNLGKEPTKRKTRFNYFKKAISELIKYAEGKNTEFLIEPVNRYEGDFFNRFDEVANFIKNMKTKKISILLDTFHMNIEEKNPALTIVKSGSLLKHIHIADSNRLFPGEGHIDFSKIKEALHDVNFKGFVSGEMISFPDLKGAIKSYIKAMKGVSVEKIRLKT